MELFRKNTPLAVFLICLFFILSNIAAFFLPIFHYKVYENGLLSYLLLEINKQLLDYSQIYIHIINTLAQAFVLNYICGELKLYSKDSFCVALSYVIANNIFIDWTDLTAGSIGNWFVIWTLVFLGKLYNTSQPNGLLLNTGLVVGAMVVCYHPTLYFIPLCLVSIAILRPFRLGEYFIFLLGAFMPFYFLTSAFFMTDRISFIYFLLPNIGLQLPFVREDILFWASFVFMVLLIVLGIWEWNFHNPRMLIQIRKMWYVVVVMLLFSAFVPFVFLHIGFESGVLCIVPFSLLLANFFMYSKPNFLGNAFFFLIVVFEIGHLYVSQFFHLK